MSEVIGTLIGLAVLGGAVYSALSVMLSRRYPRKPPGTDQRRER